MRSFLLVMEKTLVSLTGSSHVWLPKDGSSIGVNRNCTFSLEISEAMVAYECTTTQTIPDVREQKGSHQTNTLETVLEFF